jgi:hypothetical protein
MHTGVVAGLVPAIPKIEAQHQMSGVAGTSPPTTRNKT